MMFDDGRFEAVAENLFRHFRHAFGVERIEIGNAAAEDDHVRVSTSMRLARERPKWRKKIFMNSTAFASPRE